MSEYNHFKNGYFLTWLLKRLTDWEVFRDGIKNSRGVGDSVQERSVLSIGGSQVDDGLGSDRGHSSGEKAKGGKELHRGGSILYCIILLVEEF